MKHSLLTILVLSSAFVYSQPTYIPQGTVSGTTASNISQDATTGFVGIGQAAPSANLDVISIPYNPLTMGDEIPTVTTPFAVILSEYESSYYTDESILPPFYFAAKRNTYGYPSTSNYDFTVNGLGQIGVCGANSLGGSGGTSDLIIYDHGWTSEYDGGFPTKAMQVTDDNVDGGGNRAIIFGIDNLGTTSYSAGMVYVGGNCHALINDGYSPALFIPDMSWTLPNPVLVVAGQGIIGMGTGAPVAQVDINANTYLLDGSSATNLFHVGDVNQTYPDFFTIHKNGYIGIGKANTGQAITEISDVNGFGASTGPQLLVDDGNPADIKFMVRDNAAGVGIDPNGSALAIKGNSGAATFFDLNETGVDGEDDIIRFKTSDGTVRHEIFDNNASGTEFGNLVILPRLDEVLAHGPIGTIQMDGNEALFGQEIIGWRPGEGAPGADLQINTHGWTGETAINVTDDNSQPIFNVKNIGVADNSACLATIIGNSNMMIDGILFLPDLFVADYADNLANPILDVSGQGFIGIGTVAPVAELDINANTYIPTGGGGSVDYLFHVGTSSGGITADYFSVHKNGYVGIGEINSGQALMAISDKNGFGTSTGPQFLIDDGEATHIKFMVRDNSAGIGMDPNGVTLAIQGSSRTIFDMKQSSTSGSFDDMIRFINSTDVLRHIITDDYSTNNLVIWPRVDLIGSGTGTVEVEGNELVLDNVGIGIAPGTGSGRLSIKGENGATVNLYAGQYLGGTFNFMDNQGDFRHGIVDDLSTGMLTLLPGHTVPWINISTADGGGLVIGDPTLISNSSIPGNYGLVVEKGILTEQAKIAVKGTNDWSDFVFDKNYKLPELNEVEKYIQHNKHLPGIPSAKEVVKNGIDLGKMDATLVQKIEELTLYVLELKKENEEIKCLLEQKNEYK